MSTAYRRKLHGLVPTRDLGKGVLVDVHLHAGRPHEHHRVTPEIVGALSRERPQLRIIAERRDEGATSPEGLPGRQPCPDQHQSQ